MEIISFDINGKFAHFRKYYATNTAFSFTIPPRTTIIGLLAGMIGLPKDSYYKDFNSEKLRIGIAVLSPIKKSFHRLNFLKIENPKRSDNIEFRGVGKRIQTPFEVVSGIDIKKDFVKYRIFISYTLEGISAFEKIKKCLLLKKIICNPSLGTANFSAQIDNVQIFTEDEIIEKETNEKSVELNSAVISNNVELDLEYLGEDAIYIEESLMPADFIADFDRELSKMNRVLFTTNNIPLKVKFKGMYYNLSKENSSQNIQFLD